MQRNPNQRLLILILVPAALILLVPTLWIISSLTATPLHPNAESVPSSMPAPPPARWTAAADHARQIVRTSVAAQNLPGVSVAIGIDGQVAWAEGFGYADLKTGAPVTPDHPFHIGTASTALTSAAAGLLLEDGRLKLDDEIQTYVPAFPKPQQPVTLRQLMGHSPGVAPRSGDESALFTKHCQSPAGMLQHVPGDWVSFDMPGDRSRHSIYDWILVSAALESASGQPFLKFMSERVFNPANMRRTGPAPGLDPGTAQGEDFPLINMVRELIHDPAATRDSTPDPTRRPLPVRVSSYFPRFRSDPKYGVHLMRPIDYSCFAGSSAFVSTPSDLVRFGLALDHGQLLKPATVDLLQSSLRLPTGEETGYALGWQVKTVTLDGGKQARAIGQDGHAMGGMIASLWMLPDHGIVVAVSANVAHADTFSLAMKIAESFAAPAVRR